MIVSPLISSQLAAAKDIDRLADAADRRNGRATLSSRRNGAAPAAEVTIRRASAVVGAVLARLAQLDGKRLPAGPFLVAEVEGETRAALSVSTRAAVADPFRPTAELVSLLAVRADQLAAVAPRAGLEPRAQLATSH
jgi:hypothetical protein